MAVKFKTPVGASKALAQDSKALEKLKIAGWGLDYLENTNGTEEFGVLHRAQRWGENEARPSKSGVISTGGSDGAPGQGAGSNPPMGGPRRASTPMAPPPFEVASLPTLARIRRDDPRLVFAIDTEFYSPGGEGTRTREMLTWQLAFAEPADPGCVHSLVFFSVTGKRLGLGRSLAYCIARFGLAGQMAALGATACPDNGFRFDKSRQWVVPLHDTKGALWDGYRPFGTNPGWGAFGSFDAAREACGDPDFAAAYDAAAATLYQPGRLKLSRSALYLPDGANKDRKGRGLAGYVNDFSKFHRDRLAIPTVVVCHVGKADLSGFMLGDGEKDVLRQVSEVQGGLVTLRRGFALDPCGAGGEYWRFYPLNVEVRDTMCFAPAGDKSLAALGEAVGFRKLEVPAPYSKGAMQAFLAGDPVEFVEYAARDPEVTLRYPGSLFGYNKAMPVTASSAAAASIAESIERAWGLGRRDEFDAEWRGVMRVPDGQELDPRTGRIVKMYKEDMPVNDEARIIQEYARNAYKGGANGCSGPGWIAGRTYDLDLCSAYPTAMSCVNDPDWLADKLIIHEWTREDATIQEFETPFDLAWAYVDWFEFPHDVMYPCIAMNIDGNIVFPRTLGKRDGVYVTGVEIYTALMLGARVHIQRGYKARRRIGEDGEPTRSLFGGVREFVEDRAAIKAELEERPELSVFEKLEKTMVNSAYGKTAQNVIEKHTWNARRQEMEDLGSSRITSPAHASLTTAIVRCVLMAAMNELDKVGKKSFSFTTDGFITTADEADVNGLDLCGMAPYLREVREELSGSPKLWEEKHRQDRFFNATTRGNIAPDPEGVCAHNGYVSPHPSDSVEDRLYCLDKWLTRTGTVDCEVGVFAKFKDMADAVLRDDFFVSNDTHSLSMDYDMKRKPVKASLVTVHPVIDGKTYEVCSVDTVPYESPEEYELYKSCARSIVKDEGCLRTESEWRAFFERVEKKAIGVERHIPDYEWAQIFTCVMGHRLGVWRIPTLDDCSLTVDEKCAWINTFNESGKQFKPCHWKNARRQERQAQMLHRDDVSDLLDAMGAVFD